MTGSCGLVTNSRGKLRWAMLDFRLVIIGGIPAFPQRFQLLPDGRYPGLGLTPPRPHSIPSQQAVLVPRQPGQRHEQDPLLGPAGLRGDGENLRGEEGWPFGASTASAQRGTDPIPPCNWGYPGWNSGSCAASFPGECCK